VRWCFGKLSDERDTAKLHHGRVVTFSVRTQHSFLNELLSHEDEDFKQIAEVHAQTTTPIRTRTHAKSFLSSLKFFFRPRHAAAAVAEILCSQDLQKAYTVIEERDNTMFLKMRLEAGATVPRTSRASGAPWRDATRRLRQL
jgi:hypothetical protein